MPSDRPSTGNDESRDESRSGASVDGSPSEPISDPTPEPTSSAEVPADASADLSDSPSAAAPNQFQRRYTDQLAVLQRRYTDQLSQDIEHLEAQKARLLADIERLQVEYEQLGTKLEVRSQLLQHAETTHIQRPIPRPEPSTSSDDESSDESSSPTEKLSMPPGPKLPGEPEAASQQPRVTTQSAPKSGKTAEEIAGQSLELPTPATSEQQRQQAVQRQIEIEQITVEERSEESRRQKRGIWLSAIATGAIAWHYGMIGSLIQGGSWFGLNIGEVGNGFLPAAAILWLRMLILVPVLCIFAPQFYRKTWSDLQTWVQGQDRLLVLLLGSGIALFLSQIWLYQSIGMVGPVIAAALLFLYPLSAVPLGLGFKQDPPASPLGMLSLVALAMGGFLVARPAFLNSPDGTLLGLAASVAFSSYILLTNRSYRMGAHPLPVAVCQFATVTAISSAVLLVKPLTLVSISWMSFFFWGVFIGAVMLMAYLFNYASLRTVGPITAVVAAFTPLVMMIMSWSFQPRSSLAVIQLTGVLLITLGGIAIGKEKMNRSKQG